MVPLLELFVCASLVSYMMHYENMPIQIYGKFHLQKTENFQIKNSLRFFIFLLKT